ncbi:MAG: DotD/TraH family lipoprotein, partial [Legionellales bacterium]|nr:DotD/TraH family lipoprotein [Legionellales bacterium]
MKSSKWFIYLLGSILLTNCSMFSDDSDDEPEIVYTNLLSSIGNAQLQERIDVNAQLAESAASVSNSLNKLAQIEMAATPESKFNKESAFNKVSGMNEISSIDWNGPIDPIVTKIAKAGKHKYRTLGKAPSIPVIVDLHMKNVPLADILRNITYQ